MQEIIQYLRKYGQQLDSEIAAGTGIPLAKVRTYIDDLAAQGEITMCKVTRFVGDEKIVGMLCRVAGFSPPSSPGRKPGASEAK
jgi:hypothetical protein